jgi:hypothetical protein
MRAFAFRFGVVLGTLLIWPFPAGLAPGSALAIATHEAWVRAVAWFAEHVLRIDPPPVVFTGSGDTQWHWVQLALILVLATLAGALWTAIDRKPRPRIAAAMRVWLRYYLAAMMLVYGFAKIYAVQFRTPWLARYDQPIGDMSPMGLLWTFMGHSRAYTIFAGVAEIVGGVLLLWRRTVVVGAFIVIAVMTNVVLLNFCYDVPVKLFSVQLLAMTIVLVAPQLRRVIGASLGYATREDPPRPRDAGWVERARLVIKIAVIVSLVQIPLQFRHVGRSRDRAPTALDGIWSVDTMRVDGVDRPPLFTDDTRWRKLIISPPGAVVRFATDRRKFLGQVRVDASTLTIVRGISRQPLHYTRIDDRHIVLDGTLDGRELRLGLSLDDPPLLPTRGFHWVSDEPFHR